MANEMNPVNMQNTEANLVPQDTASEIADPQSNSQVYYGSFSSILAQNQGQYISVEFLIGTENLVSKEGILYASGINFLTLYDPIDNRYMVCDLYSVKFVTFFNTTTVPPSRIQNSRFGETNCAQDSFSTTDPRLNGFSSRPNTNAQMNGMGYTACGAMRGMM